MNRRVMTILLIAFFVAAVCSYAVYRVVGGRLLAAVPKTTQVVVANQDVKVGSVLQDVDLGTTEISGTPPKGAIVNRQDAIGRGVISDLYQGEPILDSRLAAVGAGGGMAATIPPGMRACAVKVDDVVGVAGFVTPGMRVDVLISGNPPGQTDISVGSKVKTLLQNIEVLSAGTDIQKDGDGKPQQVQVVNLLVTPAQAEDLSLAGNQTRIQLVLRNPLDTAIADVPGTAMGTLFADKNTPPAPKPRAVGAVVAPRAPTPTAPRVFLIQVFNGSKQSEAKFPSGEGNQ
jgi:pilus assembly protein CpaB